MNSNASEILELKKEGEWWYVQMAINGVPCLPFDVHESIRVEKFPAEEAFLDYLERQAQSMIDVFGDARQQHANPETMEARL